MGKQADEGNWAAHPPVGVVPRRPARRTFLGKAGLAGLILAVTLQCAVVAVLWCLLLLPPVVTAVDAHFNSVPFEPGRWEAQDGEYWVELDEGGQGSLRLPGDVASEVCAAETIEGDLTYRLSPTDGPGYPSVYVELDTRDGVHCSLGPALNGGGWGDGGYNWTYLNYHMDDSFKVDLVLRRVD